MLIFKLYSSAIFVGWRFILHLCIPASYFCVRWEGDLLLRILTLKWRFLFVGKSVSSLWRNWKATIFTWSRNGEQFPSQVHPWFPRGGHCQRIFTVRGFSKCSCFCTLKIIRKKEKKNSRFTLTSSEKGRIWIHLLLSLPVFKPSIIKEGFFLGYLVFYSKKVWLLNYLINLLSVGCKQHPMYFHSLLLLLFTLRLTVNRNYLNNILIIIIIIIIIIIVIIIYSFIVRFLTC